jgi:hypothetical protein
MFTLDQVVPWGRSFDEYRRMFALTDDDLRGRILGCGDGPAGFNAEAARRGLDVVSCDPLYQFSAAEIRGRIDATYDEILEQTRHSRDNFVWGEIRDVEELGRIRMTAMEAFLADYETGREQGRYVTAALPELPFVDDAFNLAVCSHLLFLYSAQLSAALHRHAALELCRVAGEVRIFPLLTLAGGVSPHVAAVREAAEQAGWSANVEPVSYEFQRGGNQMLRLRRRGGPEG